MKDDVAKESRLGAIAALINDPIARRELLWLRAKEKGDDWSLQALEIADPDLRCRMAQIEKELLPVGVDVETDRERSKAYGRAYDCHYERLVDAFVQRHSSEATCAARSCALMLYTADSPIPSSPSSVRMRQRVIS